MLNNCCSVNKLLIIKIKIKMLILGKNKFQRYLIKHTFSIGYSSDKAKSFNFLKNSESSDCFPRSKWLEGLGNRRMGLGRRHPRAATGREMRSIWRLRSDHAL